MKTYEEFDPKDVPFLLYEEGSVPWKLETYDMSLKTKKLVAASLLRGDDKAKALGYRLLACDYGQPCGSQACMCCGRTFRVILHGKTMEALSGRSFKVVRVSLISADGQVMIGKLGSFDLKKWVATKRRALERALPEGAIFLGGADVSLNTLDNAKAHWQVHLYGFVLLHPSWNSGNRTNIRSLRSSIEQRCNPIPPFERVAGERPLQTSTMSIEDFQQNFLYCHKSWFYRRSRYTFLDHRSGKVSSNVRPEGLKGPEGAEAAMFLDRWKFGSRLVLVGARRRGLDDNFYIDIERDLPVVTFADEGV